MKINKKKPPILFISIFFLTLLLYPAYGSIETGAPEKAEIERVEKAVEVIKEIMEIPGRMAIP